jgi:hypothetical protein
MGFEPLTPNPEAASQAAFQLVRQGLVKDRYPDDLVALTLDYRHWGL